MKRFWYRLIWKPQINHSVSKTSSPNRSAKRYPTRFHTFSNACFIFGLGPPSAVSKRVLAHLIAPWNHIDLILGDGRHADRPSSTNGRTARNILRSNLKLYRTKGRKRRKPMIQTNHGLCELPSGLVAGGSPKAEEEEEENK